MSSGSAAVAGMPVNGVRGGSGHGRATGLSLRRSTRYSINPADHVSLSMRQARHRLGVRSMIHSRISSIRQLQPLKSSLFFADTHRTRRWSCHRVPRCTALTVRARSRRRIPSSRCRLTAATSATPKNCVCSPRGTTASVAQSSVFSRSTVRSSASKSSGISAEKLSTIRPSFNCSDRVRKPAILCLSRMLLS
jgi:hypothetical protein